MASFCYRLKQWASSLCCLPGCTFLHLLTILLCHLIIYNYDFFSQCCGSGYEANKKLTYYHIYCDTFYYDYVK
jgi:hypothetical protein